MLPQKNNNINTIKYALFITFISTIGYIIENKILNKKFLRKELIISSTIAFLTQCIVSINPFT